MSPFWRSWQRRHQAALITVGLSPFAARLLTEVEARAREKTEPHVGREVALAAEFIPGSTPFSGTLMIDSHLIPPERRASAKAALGLPPDF